MEERKSTDTIVIHCSATPSSMDIGVDKIRKWHVDDNGWDDIGYHYVIRRDGTLEIGRDEAMVGSHARAVNGTSVGVCLIGGSDSNGKWKDNFAPIQFETLKSIILKLKDKYDIEKIIGHYQIDDRKECPSFDVPKWLEKNDVV